MLGLVQDVSYSHLHKYRVIITRKSESSDSTVGWDVKNRYPEGILWLFAETLHALPLEQGRFLKASPAHVLFQSR